MSRVIHNTSSGYTLIELLLYISILGSLLLGISMYFVTSTSARVKNQSISEVDRQGALAMEYITQTIRNADSITSPAAGATDDALTLVVPTGSLSPTVFDHDGTGTGGGGTTHLGMDTSADLPGEFMGNLITAMKVDATQSGTISTLYALVDDVASSPSNRAQMALYSGAANPTTLLASSSTVNLTPNSWNAFAISPVSITAGTTYWIAYNTNLSSFSQNNVRVETGPAGQTRTVSQTYGTWPGSWSGSPASAVYSMYAEVAITGGASGALRVDEGTNSPVLLTNEKVEVSNLTFKNLTRSGTPGVVQVSFTIYRKNPDGRNEYDYQKTFTSTAALR
jgi:type II secretory pathway pseudopilin PulG